MIFSGGKVSPSARPIPIATTGNIYAIAEEKIGLEIAINLVNKNTAIAVPTTPNMVMYPKAIGPCSFSNIGKNAFVPMQIPKAGSHIKKKDKAVIAEVGMSLNLNFIVVNEMAYPNAAGKMNKAYRISLV